ncbi:cytochrome P450 4F3 omega-hydroxylase [Lasiosphaeria miniovina]|uniref:Cytochrome P450 4F3 omega-hydroxylase n=1 Tax=Lasiosphaeria miniovina TaxID=1954250 RepID=A0AA39ZQR7_9PEZI|nr:cytochrome P450 4F3 omega-hydroxylase [Lasiosphaeria miniovina]KAK0701956.1 cytochrome P450 4F3 omega-hydroxylase [Lasiosphaeria miniovina]
MDSPYSGWTNLRDISPIKAAGMAAALYLAYYLLYAIYATTISPLAKVPGPPARKFSFLPCIAMSLQGRESHAVRDLHARYGPVVRVNPDIVSFTEPTAWREIYGYPGVKKFKKSGYRQLRPGVPDLLTASGDDHARQRAALSRAFSDKALREQEHYFQDHIDLLLARLDEKCEQAQPFNMVEWVEFLAFDIIGTLAFSSSFHCLDNQAYHPWVTLLLNFFKSTHYVLTARMCGIFFPLVLAFGPIRHLRKGEEHLRRSYEKVRQRIRMADDESRHDFWTYISRQNEHREGSMSVEEMEVNAALLIPAGSDTIATTVSGCLYLLLKTPDALARLRGELARAFGCEADIAMAPLAGLPYLRAVVDEALRLYPPISGELKRAVPPEGAVVGGTALPGGTVVSVYALAASYDARNFAQPARFAPERWLAAAERPDWARDDRLEACQPFSVGPRNCIGMNLAYAETKLILARLLWRFDFDLLDDGFDIERQKVYVMWQKPPLPVRLHKRAVQ